MAAETASLIDSLAGETGQETQDGDGAQPGGGGDAGGTGGPQSANGADPVQRKGAGDSASDSEPAKAPLKQDVVPQQALHEAREQNRQLRAKIAELEALPRLTAEDAQLLKELREQRAKPPEERDPDFLQDPKGYIDAKERKIAAALKKLEEGDTQRKQAEEQQRQQQQQIAAIVTNVQHHEAAFVKETPDYHDALTHARNVRSQQLKMMFPQATDAQISQQISMEELSAAAQILQSGGNPAEFVYNYARTLGYAPKPKGKQPDKSAARTLGSGGSDAQPDGDDDSDDPNSEILAAQAELRAKFKRK